MDGQPPEELKWCPRCRAEKPSAGFKKILKKGRCYGAECAECAKRRLQVRSVEDRDQWGKEKAEAQRAASSSIQMSLRKMAQLTQGQES